MRLGPHASHLTLLLLTGSVADDVASLKVEITRMYLICVLESFR